MCGLVYVKRKDGKEAKKMVIKRYRKQKDRGQSGFGYIAIQKDGTIKIKRATTEKEIFKALEKSTSRQILFHHRLPTSTPNLLEMTHPIIIRHRTLKYNYYLMHNGIILNDTDLKEKHEELGFTYNTEMEKRYLTKKNTYTLGELINDSEALAIELALMFEGKQDEIETRGSIAFFLAQVEKKTKKLNGLYCGRNSNPIKAHRAKDFFTLTSEGQGVEISQNNIFKIEDDKLVLTEYTLPKERTGYTITSYPTGWSMWEDEPDDTELELEYLQQRKEELTDELQEAVLTNDKQRQADIESELMDIEIDLNELELQTTQTSKLRF